MMGKTKKMDRGFLVSVGTPETAMNPDPKYALLTKIQYESPEWICPIKIWNDWLKRIWHFIPFLAKTEGSH